MNIVQKSHWMYEERRDGASEKLQGKHFLKGKGSDNTKHVKVILTWPCCEFMYTVTVLTEQSVAQFVYKVTMYD